MKYKVQEMMIIESNADVEAIDKWTAKLDEKLEKMKLPMADIEKHSKTGRGKNQSKRKI